jgi:arylsulfatase
MVDNIDQNLGRLLDTLAALSELDNTLVMFTSDNGGSSEGGADGTRSYFKQFVFYPDGVPVWTDRDVHRDPELIGGPRALVQYPRGWGMASNTPFRLYKANTHAGGIRVPFVISWPAHLSGNGGIRTEYQYVTDLFPTVLAAAGVDRPTESAGHLARSLDGSSFLANLHDPGRPSDHVEQYVEFSGNRAFYSDGWKLVSLHERGEKYDDNEWQLYDIRSDPTEVVDRAGDLPELVKELALKWDEAAWVNDVFPLDDGTGYLDVIRRPDEELLRRPVLLLAGTPTLERYRSAKLTTFRSFRVEVSFDLGSADEGVLVAHGDQGGGYVLFVENGRLWFAYNEYGNLLEVDAGALGEGSHLVELDAVAVEGLAWDFRVLVGGAERGRLDGVAMLVGEAPFEGINIGTDRRSPVSWPLFERHGPFPYQGCLHQVVYRPGAPAPYDPEILVAPLRRAGAAFE